ADEGLNYALMAFSSTSSDSKNEQLLKDLKKSELMVLGYKTGLKSVEERLEFFKTNESIYLEDIKILKIEIQMKEIAITELRKKLEIAQNEKDGIQLTIDKFENASKDLNKLINCQIVNNYKKELEYENYNAVPPPYTGNFIPTTSNLSYTSLDEFANKPVAENVKPMSSKEEAKAVRKNNDIPIIEEWVLDNEEENVSQLKIEKKTVRPIIVKKDFVKSKQQKKTTKKIVTQAEAVNTTCYVQNRMLVVKPHNKTPYEFFHGRTPTLSFIRTFGCLITILNTIDHLGKFDGKADKGFFVGYSLNSKAFRVFSSKTRIVEENFQIRISESTPNVVGSGPDWLFDIDALTRTMNYEPIVTGTQSNGFAGTKASDNAGQARKETEPVKDYILILLWTADPLFSQDPKNSHDIGSKPSCDDRSKVDEDPKK
nr:ribonuclease H-like domain-containing protein [Tanacetum cinerariifolium]